MRIKRLELLNFRTFNNVVFENIPNIVVLVSPNGRGKSSILEAIAGVHELVGPYHKDSYDVHEVWQHRSFPAWPPHLSSPVKLGEKRAEIDIEIEASGSELDYLNAVKILESIGKAHFVIEDGQRVTEIKANETIKRLFQYHNPSEGVGFIDYIRPVRFYINKRLGNFSQDLTDDTTKKLFSEFLHPYNHHEKFSTFKSFVVNSQLNDFSHLQATGEQRDSLSLFRQVFDNFFSPKRFIGYSQVGGGNPQIIVDSPFGSHDTNALSDGEKEILHILAHLYRFRDLHNIVLWDTPELHLNAALESRLHEAINKIAPNNQWWIATHSLEFINSLPLSNVFVIQQDGNAARVERASGPERKTRVTIYQEMGAQVGLQLVSTVVAFVEGKQSHSDKRFLERLVSPAVPGINFVAGGSCETILAAGTRAHSLLAEAVSNGDFLAIVDRDYRSEEQIAQISKQYGGRLFMWSVHEIENLFLSPEVVHVTLKYHDCINDTVTIADIENELKESAIALRDWIAADWIAWDFYQRYQPQSRRIGGDNPKKSLADYATSLRSKVLAETGEDNIDKLLYEKGTEIDRIIAAGEWRERLPGKQILKKFLEKYSPLTPEDFLSTAVSTIIDKSMVIPEIDRLKTVLLKAAGNI
jgi:energy-coupling factor transporter ATP-binding protein EcfA2